MEKMLLPTISSVTFSLHVRFVLVETTFSSGIAITIMQHYSSAITAIEAYLKSVLAGNSNVLLRSEMAKQFGVSKGILKRKLQL